MINFSEIVIVYIRTIKIKIRVNSLGVSEFLDIYIYILYGKIKVEQHVAEIGKIKPPRQIYKKTQGFCVHENRLVNDCSSGISHNFQYRGIGKKNYLFNCKIPMQMTNKWY